MRYSSNSARWPILTLSSVLSLWPLSAWSDTGTPQSDSAQPSVIFVYLVIAIVGVGTLVALIIVKRSVEKTKWSLSDALSEEATITAMQSDGDDGEKPVLSVTGTPLSVTELRASSSRLIALMGMMAILVTFLGFGCLAM